MSYALLPVTVLVNCVLTICGTEALGDIVSMDREARDGTGKEHLQSANVNGIHSGSAVTMYPFLTTVRNRSERATESNDPVSVVGGVVKSQKEEFEGHIPEGHPISSHHRHEYHTEPGVHGAIPWHQNPTENTLTGMGSRIGQGNEPLQPNYFKSHLGDRAQKESSEYNGQHTGIGSSSSLEVETKKDVLRRKLQASLHGSHYPSHGQMERYSGSVTDKTLGSAFGVEDIHVGSLRPLPSLKHHLPENTETDSSYNIPPRTPNEYLHLNHMSSRTEGSGDEGKANEGRIAHQSSMSGLNGNFQRVRAHGDVNGNKDRIGIELSEILDKLHAAAAASEHVASGEGNTSTISAGVVHSKPQMSLYETIQRPHSSGVHDRNMHVLQDTVGTSSVRGDIDPNMSPGRFSTIDLEKVFGALAPIFETNSEKNGNDMLQNGAGATNSSDFIYIMVPRTLDMLKGVDWSSLFSSFTTGNNTLRTVPPTYGIGGNPDKTYSSGEAPTEANAEMKRSYNGRTSSGDTYTLVPVGNYATGWSGLQRQQLSYGNLAGLGRSSYVTLPMAYNTGVMRSNGRINYHGTPFQLVTGRLPQSAMRPAAASQVAYYMLVNSEQLPSRSTANSRQGPAAGVTYAAAPAVVIPAQGYRVHAG